MLPPFARPEMYGSLHAKDPVANAVLKKRHLNLVAVFANLALPWAAFALVFWALSFHLRFQSPYLACFCAFVLLATAAGSGVMAWQWSERHPRTAHWYHYFAIAVVISVSAASILGCANYEYNMRTAYQLESDLKFYKDVNVGQAKGQQLMDAGLVTFSKGTGLDFRKTMGFKDGDTYCVAPITNGDANLPVYDFWAVGVNCCSSIKADFRCGQYKSSNARAGMRLLSAEERPHYRLAVQAAEAAYGIRAAHPLFFEWVEDPVEELAEQRSRGFQFYIFCLMMHFGFSVVGVLGSIFSLANST